MTHYYEHDIKHMSKLQSCIESSRNKILTFAHFTGNNVFEAEVQIRLSLTEFLTP